MSGHLIGCPREGRLIRAEVQPMGVVDMARNRRSDQALQRAATTSERGVVSI